MKRGPKPEDLTGKTFGCWKVLGFAPSKYGAKFTCQCICGKTQSVRAGALRSGKSRSCRCSYNSHPGIGALRPYEALYRLLIREAKHRNLVCDFSYEDFLACTEIKNCHYCGSELFWAKVHITSVGKGSCGYHLDRKDNDKGYLKENCVVCCPRCNLGKRHIFTYEEWICMTAALRKFRYDQQRNLGESQSRPQLSHGAAQGAA